MKKKFKKATLIAVLAASFGGSLLFLTGKVMAQDTDPYTCNRYCHYDFSADCDVYISPIYGGAIYHCPYMAGGPYQGNSN